MNELCPDCLEVDCACGQTVAGTRKTSSRNIAVEGICDVLPDPNELTTAPQYFKRDIKRARTWHTPALFGPDSVIKVYDGRCFFVSENKLITEFDPDLLLLAIKKSRSKARAQKRKMDAL